jgi:hypothetical protein
LFLSETTTWNETGLSERPFAAATSSDSTVHVMLCEIATARATWSRQQHARQNLHFRVTSIAATWSAVADRQSCAIAFIQGLSYIEHGLVAVTFDPEEIFNYFALN